MGQRWNYTDEFKAAAVDRLYEPGATQCGVAKELGITGTQLKTWRLEIEAFGFAEAKRRQKSDAAELERLRKEKSGSKRKWRFWIEPDQKTVRGTVFPVNASSFSPLGIAQARPCRLYHLGG